MKRTVFLLLLGVTIFIGTLSLQRQRSQLAEVRLALNARTAAPKLPTTERPQPNATPHAEERPSSELLQLRNEVTLLQRDVDAPAPPSRSREQWADDWAFVHSGPKPSQLPGFGYFTNITNAGFATPEAAFQSFNFAMRNPSQEPLDPTRMKELWDVPDDFDHPNARYSIDLGEGMGGEIGYRIVSQELIGTNQARLTIDFEKQDGSSFRRERVLVENKGRWRMKPARVTRGSARRSPDPAL